MAQDPYSIEAVQAEFEATGKAIEEIEKSSPRAERDARFEQLTVAERREYRKTILACEEGLFDLRQRYAMLARMVKALRK